MNQHAEHLIGYIVDQLDQSSTLRGLIQAGTIILGVSVDRDHLEAYVTVAVALGALLKVLLPDRFSDYRKVKSPR